jgi:DNA modification methylase
MRLLALKKSGAKECTAKIVTGLTPEQKREFIIKDNAAFGSWNFDELANSWGDLPLADWGVDLPEDWLVEEKTEPADAEPQIDRAEELNKVWKVKAGDLWKIGDHVLLCGDSTKAEDVAKVMGGEKAALMVTDPPYGVDYEGVTNDNPDGLVSLLTGAFVCANKVMVAGSPFYICHPDIHAYEFVGVIRSLGWKQARPAVVLWIKDQLVMGRGDYHSQSEPILYGWKDGAAHYPVADRSQSNVWNFPRPKSSEGHPTIKPTGLFERAISNSSPAGAIVVDPFLGSGTTMVACQNLNRKCRGIEISPDYCAVILQRMFDAFPGIEIRRIE